MNKKLPIFIFVANIRKSMPTDGAGCYNARMETQTLDQVLLPLADQFEAGKPNRVCTFAPGDVTEYERLRECLAELAAEGSVIRKGNSFQFSASGYAKYLPRIKALRVLNRAPDPTE
jgi:hypothetical protein